MPCSGINLIGGRITWSAITIAQALTPTPGQEPGTPLAPLAGGPADVFQFGATVGAGGLGVDFPLYIDPPVATGYTYTVEPGEPTFASVVVPAPLPVTGDDQFRVLFGAFDEPLVAGTQFSFTDFVPGGVTTFEIRGIDPGEGLDPTDPFAFVAGLTFLGQGPITITQAPIALCGNGTTDPGEACDDGNQADGDGCSSICVVEFCGDGVVQAGLAEQCDDGQANSDGAPDACRTDCTLARCGDLVIDSGETCDDGNAVSGDGCSSLCQDEDADGDGVRDAVDACPESVVTPTVVIDGCDSGTTNHVLANGCTISDEVAKCADGAGNHGDFVRCVARRMNELKRKKGPRIITGAEAEAIVDCAGDADIP